MISKPHLNLIISAILILSLGILSGYSLGYLRGKQSTFPIIKTVGEINKNGLIKTAANTVNIPDDALYIASQKGKYYYSVFDSRAFNISTKNRLFFRSTEEAEKKGYVKR